LEGRGSNNILNLQCKHFDLGFFIPFHKTCPFQGLYSLMYAFAALP
jgi:hypothetical protein